MLKIEITLTRRHLYALIAILAAFALIVPTAGWAADKFKDVPDSNVFHDDIAWLADAGVTKGCNPPANDEFCPDDFVTRQQMAAFMHRYATNLGPRLVEGFVVERGTTLADWPKGWARIPEYPLLAGFQFTAPSDGVVLADAIARFRSGYRPTDDPDPYGAGCGITLEPDEPAGAWEMDVLESFTGDATTAFSDSTGEPLERSEISVGVGTTMIPITAGQRINVGIRCPGYGGSIEELHGSAEEGRLTGLFVATP